MGTPYTDIVIGVRGTREFPVEKEFENCIETLVANTRNFRLILVDDNSDEDTRRVVERVAARFPTAVLIRTHTQNWFTKAFNKGLRLVRTQRAVALNMDTVLGEGWLEELYDVWSVVEVEVGPVGLVGSVYSAEEQRRYHCTHKNTAGYVTGHCWLLSMEAIARCANERGMTGWYLDETNALNAHIRSDIEICWRLNGLGYQTVCSYKSAVGHLGGRSWGHRLAEVQCRTMEKLAKIDG